MKTSIYAVLPGAVCQVACVLLLIFESFLRGALINFETAPIHPVALNPVGQTLAVCNLPDGRVELFDVSSGLAAPIGNVPVGLDPVSVRFRTANELWVINHISSSISIVDVSVRRVIATLNTLAGPADIVFAASPPRAFVSCAKVNTVQVFDPVTRRSLTNIIIDGERPKAMAVSPGGDRVYVAIFESGNASTILAPPITPLGLYPEPGPVEDPSGPYSGQNPPPNNGAIFQPPLNPDIPAERPPPIVSHIVKKSPAGRWTDDSNKDWTEYISGTNAHLSGRIQGWDMPDHDLASIDTATFDVTYVSGLMNICMDLAVNPVSGQIAVVGTDATNERRFEPNLRSTFLRVNVALVDPLTALKTVRDLNPHLDYLSRSLPQSERDKSLGDPRGILWNGNGTRAYVTGMGSHNLIVINAVGQRVQPESIEVGEGPTGMALDETRNRLYVLNRFSASVSVLDTASNTVLTNVSFFDPTPPQIKIGRRHFYDTRRNSGLGHIACASCHLDGRMDRLAWDLGDPAGDFLTITNYALSNDSFVITRSYHPMKGPMVTQTLQDIIGHEPLHWRGDREGIEQFNPTFTDLQGRDTMLTPAEMQEFKNFLRSIHFPPNRFRNLDDTLPDSVDLPGMYGGLDPTVPLVRGTPARGKAIFFNSSGPDDTQCLHCHLKPTGLGRNDNDLITSGPNGESNIRLRVNQRTLGLPFKTPQLRNLSEKLGLDFGSGSSRAGFGFTHDGRADTLSQFLFRGFPDPITNFQFRDENGESTAPEVDRNIADLIAFLFCFPGNDPEINPVLEQGAVAAQDVAAAVGGQITITSSNASLVSTFLRLADSPSNRIDLVVRGAQDGLLRGWYFAGNFLSDRAREELSPSALLALATPENPLTFTLVPRGLGRRIGIDRDDDGWPDRTEIESGFDPADPMSHGISSPPRLNLHTNFMAAHSGTTLRFTASAMVDSPRQAVTFSLIAGAMPGAVLDPGTGLFQWAIPIDLPNRQKSRVYVRVTDNAPPHLSDSAAIFLDAVPFRFLPLRPPNNDRILFVAWESIAGQEYQFQYTTNLAQAVWRDWDFPIRAFDDQAYTWVVDRYPEAQHTYFRLTLVP
ncbi:MAG TPA: hypothetical protein VJ063_13200 [Verrucomicrobiae bacterium]|nr:hypothetical protein [Verrucomicrobiae bacterium]